MVWKRGGNGEKGDEQREEEWRFVEKDARCLKLKLCV